MTAGGEKIQRYYVDRENVTPSHYGMGQDSRGEYVFYADHRAALIGELKALAKEMCEFCHKGAEFAVHPFDPETIYHNCEDLGFWECQRPEIHARIAELEREGK